VIAYVFRRLSYVAIVAAVMSLLVFAATHVLPGDAAVMILGQAATPESLAAIRAKLGLSDPLIVQYWHWAAAFVRGNMGQSLIMERPVAPVLWTALGKSLQLACLAMISVTVIGLTLGVCAAVKRNRPFDHIISVLAYVGISIPEFFWAIILLLLFAETLGWLPASGYVPLSDGLGSYAAHMVLPVATLTLTLLAHVLRMTRASMLEVLQSQYIKTARAKGLPERIVLVRHALRNGLLPTITVLAFDFGFLIGDIVVIESVFGYPGIGRMLLFAIQRHDLPLMQAIILVTTVLFMVVHLTADLLYAYFNPRIRYGSAVE
jgi:peptide/nickel transport system permease protein